MTTASELKAMIREEMNEPLDYPRAGLTGEELEWYNRGFRHACEVSLVMECDDRYDWVTFTIKYLEDVAFVYRGGSSYENGRLAAYDWILGELKSLDEDTITIPLARYHHLLDLEKSAAAFVCACGETE